MDRAQIHFCSNIIFNLATLAEIARKLKMEEVANELETLCDKVEEKLKTNITAKGNA